MGDDGYEFKFAKIDSSVDSGGGIVTTNEHFALELSYEYLQKMSNRDWEVKVYGKRNEGVFIVPKQLTKAFFVKLNCLQSKSCK